MNDTHWALLLWKVETEARAAGKHRYGSHPVRQPSALARSIREFARRLRPSTARLEFVRRNERHPSRSDGQLQGECP